MRFLAAIFAAVALIAAHPASAQQEPPSRVGRVGFIQGTLAFHTEGEAAWSAAEVNFPAATGSAFWTDPKSRAELRVGADSIDLAGNTDVEITKLDSKVMQLAVPQGRTGVRLRQLGEGESVEIDIPRGGIWLLGPGLYDIDAGSTERPARVAVHEGSARFAAGTVEVAIKTGDVAVLSGKEPVVASIERAASDEFAQWCRARDYDLHRLASPYRVSPRMTGFEELDEYGSWRQVADYGEVWFPRSLPADWAPYREGYWLWEEPWGWNWVGAEPWGFAPNHYGRWAYVDNAWAWVPGGFVADPVYAPALVGYLGDPGSVLASAATGALVGWFPLGPGEAYWPSYTEDPAYIRGLNAGIVANLGTRPSGDPASAGLNFANRRFATVVPQQVFATAQRVGRAALPVAAASAQHAAVTAQAPHFHPTTGHGRPMVVIGSGRGAPGQAAAAAMALSGRSAARQSAAAVPRFAQPRHFAAPRQFRHMAGRHFAAPRMPHFAHPHFARPHFNAPRMSAPHFAAPHFSGGGHGGGGHGGGGGGGHGGGGKGHH